MYFGILLYLSKELDILFFLIGLADCWCYLIDNSVIKVEDISQSSLYFWQQTVNPFSV